MEKVVLFGRADPLSQALVRVFSKRGLVCKLLESTDIDLTDAAGLEQRLHAEQADIVIVYPSWQARGAFLESTAQAWEAALFENVEVVTYLLQATGKYFTSAKGGRVVVLTHVAALAPLRGLSLLGTTLSAASALVKMLALELALHSTTVNAVALGPLMQGLELSDAALDRLKEDTPLEQDPLNAAVDVCLFLASEAGRHITGQTLPVEGGFLLTRGSGVSPYTD